MLTLSLYEAEIMKKIFQEPVVIMFLESKYTNYFVITSKKNCGHVIIGKKYIFYENYTKMHVLTHNKIWKK
jgi:hypothetical protein